MADHLSDLALDELTAGLRDDPRTAAHLATCERCGERLAVIRRAHGDARQAPRFETTFARVQAIAAERTARRRWPFLAVLPAAAAAVLAFVVFARPEVPRDRLKGGVEIQVVRAADATKIETARPGEQVVLAVATAGHPYLVVVAVEENGEVSALWPHGAETSARVHPGAEVRLSPAFEVTDGSIALHALFSEEPLAVAPQVQALRHAAAEALSTGRSPLEVTPPETAGIQAATQRILRVESGR